MLPCLASLFISIVVFSFQPGNCAHFWLFLRFIPAAPLLVLIATDEDYCRVVETFGFHILSWTASVVTKRNKVWLLLATQASSSWKCYQHDMVVLGDSGPAWSPCTMRTGASNYCHFPHSMGTCSGSCTNINQLPRTSNRNMEFGHRLCCYDNSNVIYLTTILNEAFCMYKNLMYEVLVIWNVLKPKQVLFAFSGVIIAIATETFSNSSDS